MPRYDCLQEVAANTPGMDISACEVFLSILSTGNALSKAEGNFLNTHGLSQGRLIVLMLLACAPEGTLRSSDLATVASVSRATMTGLLDTLERDGLISRAMDPEDRRVVRLTITPRGRTRVEETTPLYFQWMAGMFAVLSEPERQQLTALLRKAHAAFSPSAEKTSPSDA